MEMERFSSCGMQANIALLADCAAGLMAMRKLGVDSPWPPQFTSSAQSKEITTNWMDFMRMVLTQKYGQYPHNNAISGKGIQGSLRQIIDQPTDAKIANNCRSNKSNKQGHPQSTCPCQ